MNIQRSCHCFLNLKLVLSRRLTANVSEHRKNHYDSLGITPKATQGDIKSAYYKLSKEYHPDVNKGDEAAAEKFRNITSAYEVLGNVKSRKVYDRGLLVGSYQTEQELRTDPTVDKYPHASFYHHRNQPTSRKTQSSTTTNYDIDEWTRAHYSKTVNMKIRERNSESWRKDASDTEEMQIHRSMLVFCIAIAAGSFLFYEIRPIDRKFDKSSSDKSDK